MHIYIAADHAGYALKEVLIDYVRDELGHSIDDLGAHELLEDDDYPDLIAPVAHAVVADNDAGTDAMGIIIGGSGQGEAMAANRVPRARAIVYYGGDHDIVRLGREHNDANILSLGARFVTIEDAKNACNLFLDTFFSEESRHVRRIQELN